ncbi:hypothetical protein KBD69_01340 [Candidatus Woesebacteria bacterium]|nr:hypothetical protein [Candidatus Woesebacteria bacterium]
MNYKKIALGLFAIFCLIMSWLVIMPSALTRCDGDRCGDYYFGAHEHDGVWHIAVAEMMLDNSDWQMPTFADQSLTGYNYGIDLLVAGLAKITPFSSIDWYYRGIPFLWGIAIVYYLLLFARQYRPSSTSYPWFLLIFSFFGSSFSYFLNLYHNGTIWGSSGLLSMQSLQVMTNPQLGLSLLLLVIYFTWLMKGGTKTKSDYLILGLLAAGSLALKFYTGLIFAFIIVCNFVIEIKNDKKIKPILVGHALMLIPALLVAVLLYQPTGRSFPLVFEPFAPVTTIIEDSNLFYLPTLAQRLYTTSGISLLGLNIFVTVIFVIMNYGVRVASLFAPLIKSSKNTDKIRLLLIVGSLTGLIFSIFFVQTGIWWNTVQFLHVSLFLSGILAAEVFDHVYALAKSNLIKLLIVTTLLLLLLPNNIDIIRTFTTNKGTSYISSEELEALSILKKMPEGVVFAPAFTPGVRGIDTTPLLSQLYDTAYITAYTGKVTYFADVTQLDLLSIPYTERAMMVQRYDCLILDEVDYLYEEHRNSYLHQFEPCKRELRELFKNSSVAIYEVVN